MSTKALSLILVFVFGLAVLPIAAQTTYDGTILSYGSGARNRTATSSFRLTINGTTTDSQVAAYLELLQTGGQTDLLDGIRKEDLGTFSVNNNLARTLNVVRSVQTDGKTRIHIVFERWMQFAELRGGYRSTDFPFTYIELLIDPATGKGEGTFIAAAQIRWKKDKNSDGHHVEIEDFATFPARLLNVRVQTPRR